MFPALSMAELNVHNPSFWLMMLRLPEMKMRQLWMIPMRQPLMPQPMLAVSVEMTVTMTMLNTTQQNSVMINLGLELLMWGRKKLDGSRVLILDILTRTCVHILILTVCACAGGGGGRTQATAQVHMPPTSTIKECTPPTEVRTTSAETMKVRAMPTCTTRDGVIGPHAHSSVGRQVVDNQDNSWRGGALGPHAHRNTARHVVDNLNLEGRGQQKL